MYCSKCGTADQQIDTYCRNCGVFLPDSNSDRRNRRTTPEDQFKLTLTFNIISALAALSMAIMLYVFHFGKPGTHPSVFMAAAFLLVIAVWQIISYFNNRQLKKRFIREKEDDDNESKNADLLMSGKNKSLPEADFSDNIPASVVENTTKKLKVEDRKNI